MKRFFYSAATLLLMLLMTNLYLGDSLLEPQTLPETARNPIRTAMAESMESGARVLPDIDSLKQKQLDYLIEKKSLEFVITAFSRDAKKMGSLLAKGTAYILLPEGDSYIRYISGEQHVEGYMATDKALLEVKHKWYVEGDRGTIISGLELRIEEETAPQTWFIHFRKVFGQWRVFMLENGI